MLVETSELMSVAESLPIDMKIQLIDKLLNSLHPSEKTIDSLWAQEAENRVQSIKNGEAKLVDGEQVFAKIRQRFE